MGTVTKRQREVLDFIESFTKQHRFSPSFEEIRDAFGLASLATIHKHIKNLEHKGFLRHAYNRSRSLEVVSAPKKERFISQGPDRMWDNVLHCFWVREKEEQVA